MTDYTKTTNFAAKDSLPSGNANKIVKGAEIDTEFTNIATASATKADIASPTFTGTVTIPTADINGGAVDGTTIGAASASSIVGTTIVANTSINIASDGATVTGIKDEDDMASDSATKLATQQSIKAYVDSQVTAQDLDVTDGSSSIDIDLDSESLGILGGTGIDSTASGTGVTLAIDSTVATLTGSQTLTNKTLTAPTLTGTAVVASLDISGDVDVDGTLETDALSINGTTVTSTAAELNILDGVTSTAAELNILDGVTATTAELNILDGVTSTAAELNILDGVTSTTAELNILDGVTSTAAELNILDGKAFLDEDDMSSDSATGIASQQSIKAYVDAQITAEDLDFQADSGGALSIDLDSETLTFTGGTGIDTSGSGNAVTFAIDSTVATLTGSQTLTNKSLTAPTLTGTAVVASLDISGDIDVDGTTNLDVVDIDGAVDFASTTAHAGNATFADNAKAIFGAGSDLEIYHTASGNHSIIEEVGGGNLVVRTNGPHIEFDKGSTEFMARMLVDGAVELYYDSDLKLATTSTGIDVTGSVTADGAVIENSSGATLNINTALGSNDSKILLHEGTTASPSNGASIRYDGANNLFKIGVGSSVDTTRLSIDRNTGDISFYEDTGTTPKFFWDASAESLGIGLSSGISSKLHVNAEMSLGADGDNRAILGYASNAFTIGTRESSTNYFSTVTVTGGNVGIGRVPVNTLSPSLEMVSGGSLFGYGDALYLAANLYYASAWKAMATGGGALYVSDANGHRFYTSASASAGAAATPEQRVGIDSIGNLIVGKTSNSVSTDGTFIQQDGKVFVTAASNYPVAIYRSNGNGRAIGFYSGTTLAGWIEIDSTSAVSINSSSDQRLKENIQDAKDAGELIDAIQVRQFDWKVDGEHQRYGMIAQELTTVAPEAVSTPEDPDEMMGVDYSKLVPMLIKEIQTLRTRVAQLENN
jgi:hypothetical protein